MLKGIVRQDEVANGIGIRDEVAIGARIHGGPGIQARPTLGLKVLACWILGV